MVDSSGVSDFDELGARFFSGLLADSRRRDALPVELPTLNLSGEQRRGAGAATEQSRDIKAQVTVFPLGSDAAGWHDLSRRLTFGSSGSDRWPWYRSLAILRGHGAMTAVLEHYYVCLDYRSEYAAFYAHLDAPRTSWTTRVHFFDTEVAAAQVTDLSDRQREGYLGYVVCRSGDLPLVGRTVLRVPRYIVESTAIEEHVNFFGQDLFVVGVPFMQQDARFAVCAHVVCWAAHYTAYRRGFVERKLIADFVEAGGLTHPLRPRGSDGLAAHTVVELFDSLGFRTSTVATPISGYNQVPNLRLDYLPRARHLAKELKRLLPKAAPVNRDYTSQLAVDAYLYCVNASKDDEYAEECKLALPLALELVELLLDAIVRPYLRSLCPIYAMTFDHAVLLCGRSGDTDKPVYYVHDDQLGPYLAAPSLVAMSREELLAQAHVSEIFQDPTTDPARITNRVLPRDRVAEVVRKSRAGKYSDDDRAVATLLIPCPPRALLAPTDALEHAERYMQRLSAVAAVTRRGSRTADGARATLCPGLNYKRDRRAQAEVEGDNRGRDAFSAVQLAEWVVVVEGELSVDASGSSTCRWELVFDASSGGLAPRVQLVRLGRKLVAEYPGHPRGPEHALLASDRYRTVRVRLHSPKLGEHAPEQGQSADAAFDV